MIHAVTAAAVCTPVLQIRRGCPGKPADRPRPAAPRAAKDSLLGSPTVSPARPGTRGNLRPPAARAAPLLGRGRVTGNRGQGGSAAPTRAAPPRGARRACGRRPRRAPDTRAELPARGACVCVAGRGRLGQPLPSGRLCPRSPARSGPAPGEARGAPLPPAPTGTALHPRNKASPRALPRPPRRGEPRARFGADRGPQIGPDRSTYPHNRDQERLSERC